MTNVSAQSDVRNAKDRWMMACDRQRAAEAAWDDNACEATNAAVAAARKAQVKAWRAWDRAEQRAAA